MVTPDPYYPERPDDQSPINAGTARRPEEFDQIGAGTIWASEGFAGEKFSMAFSGGMLFLAFLERDVDGATKTARQLTEQEVADLRDNLSAWLVWRAGC